MRTKLIIYIFLLFSGITGLSAQVTIGSIDEPQDYSALEVVSSAKGGLRMPRLTTTERENLDLGSLTGDAATKAVGLVIYNTTTKQPESWDGSKWITGKAVEPWFVSGGTVQATSNTQNIYHMGSVTIGDNSTADPTAILNVKSDNKGVLLPQITLTSSTDDTTIPNPTTGLLVYNTGANSNFKTSGYMFWDGASWKLFANSSSDAATATLSCAGAAMSPAQQIVGSTSIIAGTVIQIPYTGSNGGSFNGITLTSKNNPNVTATIADGMLSVGNGILNFTLSGTPTIDQQAPNGITFDLTPFLADNPGISGCNEITVGHILTASIENTAVMGYLMHTTDNTGNDTGTKGYTLQCNSPDGKFSVRVRVPESRSTIAVDNDYINIQVRNNQATPQTIIWNYRMVRRGGTDETANMFTMPAQIWGGTQGTSTTWTNATDSGYGGYWGDRGIYEGGPEFRRYTWIPMGPENKVAYEIIVMCALDTSTPTVAVSPTKLKVYIKFEQVTAQ